jgi:hypothetical protein
MRRGRGDIFGEVSYYQTGNWGSTQEWTAGSKRVVIRELPGTLIDRWVSRNPVKSIRPPRKRREHSQVYPANDCDCKLKVWSHGTVGASKSR